MAPVHFSTIPSEPNRATNTHRKPYFAEIHPCTNKIVYAEFEVFRPFLYGIYEQFYDFHALRIMGECISRHLFQYGELMFKVFLF